MPAATLEPGDLERTLTVDGVERIYYLHIPPGLDSAKPAPIVFAFHGYDVEVHFEISDLKNVAGFDAISDNSGFLLVYPSGLSGVWNAGSCCGIAVENNVDEIAYVRQILADVGTIAVVDPKRIYASGFSNGALLSFRLACEMSDVFAAVAPVAGVLVTNPCQPQEPVSIIQIHGMLDTAVPYEGGQNPAAAARFPPIEESLATWAQLDGCTGEPQVEQDGIITHTVYGNCQPGIGVELYALEGMGHSWPSPYITTPSLSQVIWDFFAAHPKQ